MSSYKPHVLLMGQTPPPWHGQAVATQILFDHDWPDFEVHRLRMEFSEEMLEVGRFQWKKIRHLFRLILKARRILKRHPGCVLFYPPASAKWIPFLRDVVFLASVRHLTGATVFIFHASGLPVFGTTGSIRRILSRLAYFHMDVALEVAQENYPAHEAFAAKSWRWCPCGIAVPERVRAQRLTGAPLTVLFVGSLQEGKGVTEVLKTASVLKQEGREKDFHFRIVGKWFSEEYEKEVSHLRVEWGLETMVELVGQLTGDDKWDAYFSADAFFFPTHYASEATPIVLMEALGAGLPIVSTHWAGIPAMLEGCDTAFLQPVKSPSAFAGALKSLHDSRNELPEIARRARKFYESRFLPERFIERVAEAFQMALGHGEAVLQSPAAPCFGESARGTLTLGNTATPKHRITVYLADQNPGHDRSFGISRMSQVVLDALQASGRVRIDAITSQTSQQPPDCVQSVRVLPWGTRRKWVRLLTDHFHPLFHRRSEQPDLYYFPKGYLPWLSVYCRPSVVTIHDTIIQYDEDHYPEWRSRWEYAYWAKVLRHTLRHADRILTVSETSKHQIEVFMERHQIPRKEIKVTYEPCAYEQLPQPENPLKEDYVVHLASVEPHKRTAHLIRWWHQAEANGMRLPMLHLIGTVPPEVEPLLSSSRSIVKRPFLEDSALQAAYQAARALVLPSEIEGFGLPALEAYYLGTPVCFVQGTSVEEILSVATNKGAFSLDLEGSLFAALDEVMSMSPEEIHACGLKLREIYAAEKVAERIVRAFEGIR